MAPRSSREDREKILNTDPGSYACVSGLFDEGIRGRSAASPSGTRWGRNRAGRCRRGSPRCAHPSRGPSWNPALSASMAARATLSTMYWISRSMVRKTWLPYTVSVSVPTGCGARLVVERVLDPVQGHAVRPDVPHDVGRQPALRVEPPEVVLDPHPGELAAALETSGWPPTPPG